MKSAHHHTTGRFSDEEKALARLQEPETTMCSYHPTNDALMQFLQAL